MPLWRRKLVTLADLFRQRFSPGVERFAVLLLVPTSLMWAAAQIRALGQVISASSAFDVELAIGIAAGFVIVYTVYGGLMANAVTDLVQGGHRSTAAFFLGTKPEYPRRMHTIQGSDSHRLRTDNENKKNLGVGDRATEFLLPQLTFEALKELFLSNDFARTRPHKAAAEAVYDFILQAREEGPSIVQGFARQHGAARGGTLRRHRRRVRPGQHRWRHGGLLAGALSALAFQSAMAGTITGSAHDFTTSAWSGGRICVACHAPHNTNTSVTDAPLWSHALSTATYTLYSSTTMNATLGQPSGLSKLCLSCHDGTVAVDSFGGRTGTTVISGGASLGTALNNDHPIGFTYNTALASADGSLYDPSTKTITIGSGGQTKTGTIAATMLYGGRLECSSCHDVHNTFTAGSGNLLKGSFTSDLRIPVLLQSSSSDAKEQPGQCKKSAPHTLDAYFVFIVMEAWSLRKDKLHQIDPVAYVRNEAAVTLKAISR